LRQILLNIVNNAIKFTLKGSITIAVRQLRKTKNNIYLEIAIQDTGPGIPSEKIDLIFKPFQQLEDTYTRASSQSGTGLGLAIVKKFAELLNLKIQVKSKLGEGSTFSLTGKFVIDKDTNQKNKKADKMAPKKPSYSREKIRVLLIEDDPIVRRIHQNMIEELGCTVEAASQGYEALKLINDHDILFIDIGLPDIPGFKVIQMLRNEHNSQVPIIALTGYTGNQEREVCLAAGADDVLNKPISLDHLQGILDRYL
ncbi:MAG: response regulator, partial [Gammaproteobacteria bacterium]